MRGVSGVVITGVVALAIFVVSPAAEASSGKSTSSGCSRATAKRLIHEHPHLDPWAPIYEAPGAVLCGSFLGKGSDSLVMSFAAATCGGSSGWAAFRRQGNGWELVWKHRDGQKAIAAAGTDIKETLTILRPGDPRCIPTGGEKARTWHWNGSRFVAGPFRYVNPVEFLSPDRMVWCSIGEGYEEFCAAGSPAAGDVPRSSAFFGPGNKITLCHAEHSSLAEGCSQNWNPAAPVLRYGEKSKVGDIRCASATSGITCVKISGPGKGSGFRINKDEAVRVGTAGASRAGSATSSRAASRAAIWGALGGKVICGLSIHPPEAPPELLCAARSVPAPKQPSDYGDPGFVFLGSAGSPRLTRLSQYSWERENGWASHVELKAGRKWSSNAVGVTCSVRKHAIRCVNESGHGFTIKARSYRSF